MYQLKQIPSETKIKKYIRRIVFGKNLFCPECRSRSIIKYGDRYRCKRCRRKFSLISHTWLKGMRISYQKFWLILWCWTAQVPIKQSMALSKLSEKSVRHWFGLFRSNLPENAVILEKIVQLDEAFFKQRTLMMAKQKGTRNLAFEILTTTKPQRHHATYFLKEHIKPRSKLHTDGASIYKNIQNWWPVRHKRDIHKKWEFALTSEIEGAFGNYRTFIRRMYHHHRSKNLSEYVSEFCFRFSSPEIFDSPLKYLQKTLFLVPTR
jgi:transposase-like protein